MSDYPDVSADAFQVTVGQYGVTITFRRSDPTAETGPQGSDPNAPIVARIRCNQALAEELAKIIGNVSAQNAIAVPIQQSKKRN